MIRVSPLFSRSMGSGGYSKMMDLGGYSTKESKSSSLRMGKNLKIQVVLFNFATVSSSISSEKLSSAANSSNHQLKAGGTTNPNPNPNEVMLTTPKKLLESVVDNHVVKDMANILNFDLNAVLGKSPPPSTATATATATTIPKTKSDNPIPQSSTDEIRNKYAALLSKKLGTTTSNSSATNITETISNLASAKSAILSKGDASLNATAKALASSQAPLNVESSRWLVVSGVGTLFEFLNKRSMKVALIPSPSVHCASPETEIQTLKEMAKVSEAPPLPAALGLMDAAALARGMAHNTNYTNIPPICLTSLGSSSSS